MSQIPEQLLPIAIRGTIQSPVDLPKVSPALDQLSQQADGLEGKLLMMLGGVGLQLKSGYAPKTTSAALPADQAPVESKAYVSPAADHVLYQILSGSSIAHLGEWLALAAEHNQLVRPEHLPSLIQHGAKHPLDRYAIWTVMGHRGRWLADRFDPKKGAWTKVDDPDRQWAETTTTTQKGYLIALHRKIDPVRGRSLLEQRWEDIGPAALVTYLETLEPLTLDDEVLLEKGLSHSAGRVRHAAAKLLGQLPASRFVTAQTTRLLPLLTVSGRLLSKGLRLDRARLEAITAAADWVDFKPPAQTSADQIEIEKMSLMLSMVPIQLWLAHLQLDVDQLLKLTHALPEPERSILFGGVKRSAIRTRHAPLCRALYRLESKQKKLNLYDRGALLDSLNGVENGAILEEMITAQLRVRPKLSSENPALFLLSQKDPPWSPALVDLTFDRLRRLIINSDPKDGPTHLHIQLLNHLGKILPVRIAAGHLSKLLKVTEHHGKWRRAVYDLDGSINFRIKMHEAFE